jgi:hypothetical protein
LLSGSRKNRSAGSRIALALLLLILPAVAVAEGVKETRRLSGNIYFTNNTPKDKSTYPIELYTTNRRKRVASTRPFDGHSFELNGIRAGKYLLKVTRPGKCVLWYRVDLRTVPKLQVRVIMDAACAHANGKVQDITEN